MSELSPIPDSLDASRQQFAALLEDVRPELHRYCARMVGSVLDGEDVVQDTLAKAYDELAQLREMPAMRTWLFRIAHRKALDALRRRNARPDQDPLDEATEPAGDMSADEPLLQADAVDVAVSRFLELAPAQRACVVLKDVFDYSLAEIGEVTGLTRPAVKSALFRGRVRLRELAATTPPVARRVASPEIVRYAARFNARDWAGVREMLAADVRLDVVTRETRRGASEVGHYFGQYDRIAGWHAVPAWVDGREVLAVRHDAGDADPAYVVAVTFEAGLVASIRDFRYVPYVVHDTQAETSLRSPIP